MVHTQTPVALIIFNRPEPTAAVFAEIAKARPSKLFVIADGPRPDRPGEAQSCADARAVTEQVDWPCHVQRNYSQVNLGCQARVVSGINWLFEQVEEAIIIEDDCVPRQSFFRFCDEMLSRYRNDERVMMVSGRYSQYLGEQLPKKFQSSYDFVCFGNCWGWATWRRAWQYFDLDMMHWPVLRESSRLDELFQENNEAKDRRKKLLDEIYAGRGGVNAWDYQWQVSIWARGGLSIVPRLHLVSNVGFGEDATHTRSNSNNRGELLDEDLAFPLSHPARVQRNFELDQRIVASGRPRRARSLAARALLRFRKSLSRLYYLSTRDLKNPESRKP